MLITHMQDLQEVTQEVHYENYRSQRLAKSVRQNGTKSLKSNGSNGHHLAQEEDFDDAAAEKDQMLREKEAELKRMQEMLTQMQAKMQQAQQ